MAYTTTDAVRSVKKYVATLLGAADDPLAAVKQVPRVPDADLAPLIDSTARVVACDFGQDGSVVTKVWTSADVLPDTADFVVLGRYQGDGWVRQVSLLAAAPGSYLNADGTVSSWAGDDPHVFTPGLIAGFTNVSQDDWSKLLSDGTRWARTWDRATAQTDGGYRLAVTYSGLQVTPLASVADDALPQGAEWDVRFFHDRGEFEYPVAIVKTVGPTLTKNFGGYVELTQPLTLYAYPTPPDLASTDPGTAQVEAEKTRDLLIAGLTAGTDLGRPLRIPLYDYDGLGETTWSDSRQPYDFLRVVDVSVDLQPEPGDPRQLVAIADVRVSWRRSTDPVADDGQGVVEEVRLADALA